MPKIIELPDGSEAEFPDDMSDEAIGGVLQKQFPAPKPSALPQATKVVDPRVAPLLDDRMPSGNVITSGIDAALAAGTGLAKSIQAGSAGMYEVAKNKLAGDTWGDAASKATDRIHQIQGEAYQPRTEGGKGILDVAAYPFTGSSKTLGDLGAATGSPGLEAIGRAGPEMLGAIAMKGGPKALKGAAPVEVPSVVKTLRSDKVRAPETTFAERQGSRQNAAMLDAVKVADDLGLDVPSFMSSKEITLGNKVAGVNNILNEASKRNRPKVQQIILDDLGETTAREVTPEVIRRAEVRAAEPFAQVEKVSKIDFTAPEFVQEIGAADGMANLGETARALVDSGPQVTGKIARLQDLASGAKSFTGTEAVKVMQDLRRQAKETMDSVSANPAEKALARTQRAVSDAMQRNVSRELMKNPGTADLGRNFGQVWENYGKVQDWKGVIDPLTGDANLGKLARDMSEGAPLSGRAKQLATLGAHFEDALRGGGKAVGDERAPGGARQIAGRVGGVPLLLGERFVVPWVSKALRDKALRPDIVSRDRLQDYRFQGERGDFVGPQQTGTPAAPLPQEPFYGPLKPQGFDPNALTTTGEWNRTPAPAGPTIQPRPTLELAEPNANVGALRNKGAKIPLGPEPVEFTPGATQDFMLRQEKLHGYESATLKYLREKVADLEAKRDNSSGFWKNRYAKEIETMKPILEEEKAKYGITDAASEHGLRRKLYEPTTEQNIVKSQSNISALRRKAIRDKMKPDEPIETEQWLR